MKKTVICLILSAAVILSLCVGVAAGGGGDTDIPSADVSVSGYGREIDAVSAILMEASSGKVLFEQNADEALPPASVTKTMTMLLVLEAIDDGKISLDDVVSVSENAASMGGSQVFLEPGEQMSVNELLKCMIIASANDAAVALAEFTCGSEEAFVERMNTRAAELGCTASRFVNPTGLDDTAEDHVMSARDIALISREILRHPKVFDYTTIWMDTIRDGAFGLTNTNRLIRFYGGATGLKTGSTAKAKFCISATAERNGVSLIAVIMAAPTKDVRNSEAKALLDYGFANYSLYKDEPQEFPDVYVAGGEKEVTTVKSTGFSLVVGKGDAGKVEREVLLPDRLTAGIRAGDKVGEISYTLGGEKVGAADIVATEDVDRIGFFGLLLKLGRWFLLSPEK